MRREVEMMMLGRLSTREREVMLLKVKGLSNKRIARQLNICESTVKEHLKVIYRKLAVGNRTKLAVLVAKLQSSQSDGRPLSAEAEKVNPGLRLRSEG